MMTTSQLRASPETVEEEPERAEATSVREKLRRAHSVLGGNPDSRKLNFRFTEFSEVRIVPVEYP